MALTVLLSLKDDGVEVNLRGAKVKFVKGGFLVKRVTKSRPLLAEELLRQRYEATEPAAMMMKQETKQRITEAKSPSMTYSSGTANSQLEQTRADASGTANSQLMACSKVDFLQYGDFSGWKVQFGIDIISWQ